MEEKPVALRVPTPLHVATDKIEGRPVYYKRYKDIDFPQKKEG